MTTDSRVVAHYEAIRADDPQAPWITLVHGVSQDHRLFDRQVAAFGPDFNVLLVDLPGHGRSAAMPGPFGLPEYAASLGGALAEAEVTKTHFWGTHLGAGAGLLLACASPTTFDRLILEAPVFPGRPLPSVSSTLERVCRAAREHGMDAAREIWWQEGGWFDVMRTRPDVCRAAAQRAMIDDFPGRPWLDTGLLSRPIAPIDEALVRLPHPVLLINGEHDLEDFLTATEALAERLPDCRRAVIAEAGGFPLWELPDRVNEIVSQFLGRP